MLDEQPDSRYLSPSEQRRLTEIEQQIRRDDPALERSLRTGRQRRTVNPIVAAVVAIFATPIIALIYLLTGPDYGALAVAVSLAVLVLGGRILDRRPLFRRRPLSNPH
jgi:hypothetical protein